MAGQWRIGQESRMFLVLTKCGDGHGSPGGSTPSQDPGTLQAHTAALNPCLPTERAVIFLASSQQRELARFPDKGLNLGAIMLRKCVSQAVTEPSLVETGWNSSQTKLGFFRQRGLKWASR